MSYGCQDSTIPTPPRLFYHSNPSISVTRGGTSYPTGDANKAVCASLIAANFPAVAAYTASANNHVSPTPSPKPTPSPSSGPRPSPSKSPSPSPSPSYVTCKGGGTCASPNVCSRFGTQDVCCPSQASAALPASVVATAWLGLF